MDRGGGGGGGGRGGRGNDDSEIIALADTYIWVFNSPKGLYVRDVEADTMELVISRDEAVYDEERGTRWVSSLWSSNKYSIT